MATAWGDGALLNDGELPNGWLSLGFEPESHTRKALAFFFTVELTIPECCCFGGQVSLSTRVLFRKAFLLDGRINFQGRVCYICERVCFITQQKKKRYLNDVLSWRGVGSKGASALF